MFDYLKNTFLYSDKYKTHSEAVIVSCFFNPQKSLYRLKAFHRFYESIKHLNHHIVECVIGDSKAQLPESPNITRVYTEDLLWHKEGLLNSIILGLPEKYKYVFWIDADVIFTNNNWLVDSVKEFEKGAKILQPFEYCIHLEKNERSPNFIIDQKRRDEVSDPKLRHPNMWRSFCANYVDTGRNGLSNDKNYDKHGHVGFAWGALRSLLEDVPLYDRGLIGGGDHIIAHAAAGQIPHNCITKSFTDNIDEVLDWSYKFYAAAGGRIGYVAGDLYHIWHGDIKKRQYLKRIQDFTKKTKEITQKDKNGLYVGKDPYVKKYFDYREVVEFDDGFMDDIYFLEDLGYMLGDLVDMYNSYQNNPEEYFEGNQDQFIENQTEQVPADNSEQTQWVEDNIQAERDLEQLVNEVDASVEDNSNDDTPIEPLVEPDSENFS